MTVTARGLLLTIAYSPRMLFGLPKVEEVGTDDGDFGAVLLACCDVKLGSISDVSGLVVVKGGDGSGR